MPELTLVPSALAKPGYRFRYMGDPGDEACDGCPVRTLCYRLTPGEMVEVVEVRDVEHPCGLHEGKARVCTVKPAVTTTTVQSKGLRGTAVSWAPVPCGYPECDRYGLCHPTGLAEGRYEVAEDAGEEPCPMHYTLRRVKLRPLP